MTCNLCDLWSVIYDLWSMICNLRDLWSVITRSPPQLLKMIKNYFVVFFNNQYCRCVFIINPSFFTCLTHSRLVCGRTKSRNESVPEPPELDLVRTYFRVGFSFAGGYVYYIFNSTISKKIYATRIWRSDCLFSIFERPLTPPFPRNTLHFILCLKKSENLSRFDGGTQNDPLKSSMLWL